MAGRFSVEAVFKATDRITAPITRMQNRVGKFTRSMNRGFRTLNSTVGRFAKSVKRASLAFAASIGIVGIALTKVIGTGADFEQAITNVGAVALKTRDQIKPLENLALKLGRTTKFTATQAAGAMEIMSRAGFKVNEILNATPAVLAAAAASGLEIADVADVVSNALKGMGLEANQAANVADVLALASSKTNSSIGSLGESLKNVASTARQLDIPLTDTVAAIALLQDVGLDASVAGSAFNVMLTKMAAPTTSITKKMRRFGISFKDAKGDMLPLQKVLQQLNVASKKAGGNFDKVAFLAELVGLRGQKAASNLGLLFETGKLDKLIKQLEKAGGSAKKMAAIRMDTLKGSLLLLGSAVDAVKVKIFDLQDTALKGVVDKMTAWVGVNEQIIATNIAEFLVLVVDNLDKITVALGDILTGVGALIALSIALKGIAAVIALINVLVAANPIVLLILAAVAAVALLTGALDPVIELISNIGSGIKNAFSAVSGLFNIFGGDDDEEKAIAKSNAATQTISPQDRVARSVEESRTTERAELTIRGETDRVKISNKKLASMIKVQPSGAF